MNHVDKINNDIFKEETNICKKQSQENNGQCNWGKCADCGVIPLLIKLNKGEIIENEKEILRTKKDYGVIYDNH